MEIKEKPCKGSGKAIGLGCGIKTKFRRYGLCMGKCFNDFLLNTEEGKKVLAKNTLRGSNKVKKEVKQKANKQKREDIDRLKGKQNWEKDLEKIFNEFIRLRDRLDPCISCDKIPGDYTVSAGHYFPAGSSKGVRFDEDNVHAQCWWDCNKNKHGNLIEYRPRLIHKIGRKRYDELVEREKIPAHFSIPEIKEMISYYKKKVKEMKNDL